MRRRWHWCTSVKGAQPLSEDRDGPLRISEVLRRGGVDAWQRGGHEPLDMPVAAVVDQLGYRRTPGRATMRSGRVPPPGVGGCRRWRL